VVCTPGATAFVTADLAPSAEGEAFKAAVPVEEGAEGFFADVVVPDLAAGFFATGVLTGAFVAPAVHTATAIAIEITASQRTTCMLTPHPSVPIDSPSDAYCNDRDTPAQEAMGRPGIASPWCVV